ncbi:hypothetical protein NDU88_006578 [Pleurodeles waltl]|uniref:Uncharacterized protein n=1 Tax=Pleurodeles waltl TaxID=8319 RepID=A0AAV7MZM5_PLEWA|nr:hypothetical protein NDU88_006578 [Pleurodeles waltl]
MPVGSRWKLGNRMGPRRRSSGGAKRHLCLAKVRQCGLPSRGLPSTAEAAETSCPSGRGIDAVKGHRKAPLTRGFGLAALQTGLEEHAGRCGLVGRDLIVCRAETTPQSSSGLLRPQAGRSEARSCLRERAEGEEVW